MKASESLQNDQSTATESALRRAVDTTPAFICTVRPDGYLDYFNGGWLDFLCCLGVSPRRENIIYMMGAGQLRKERLWWKR